MQCNLQNMPKRFAWKLKHALKMDLFADFSKNVPYHEAFKNIFALNKSTLTAREIIANQKRLQWNKSHANPLRKSQVMIKIGFLEGKSMFFFKNGLLEGQCIY